MVQLRKSVEQLVAEAREHVANHTPAEAKRRVDEEDGFPVVAYTPKQR
jgi:hypothetical protein